MKNALQSDQKGWDESRVQAWRDAVLADGKKRDYGDVVSRITRLPANTHIVERHAVMEEGNPLYRITVGDVDNGHPNILITGGVHGYEPSGVEAALTFAQANAPSLTDKFNFVIYPCLSPWAYEYDQRWNADGEDPNRLFTRMPKDPKPGVFRTYDIEECRHFMNSMEAHNVKFTCAIDLHETCDRDIELRILRSERFDEALAPDYQDIPQGYYLTLSERGQEAENDRQLSFGRAIIEEVQKISPIAPKQFILNGKKNYSGIILSAPYDGLMRAYLDNHAELVAVTEVYPDHKDMTPQKSVAAQLASIQGALNFTGR